MLTVGTSDLHVVLVSDLVELGLVGGGAKLGQVDVDGGAHGGTEVSGAGGDVAEVGVVSELADGLDVLGSAAESVEDFLDAGTGLHGDDTELVLLVDPDEEGLFLVVEDTSALGPVAVEVASLEESVTFPIN